ncbi:hypothetical protein AeMF1_010945 [Aphanomyces euteiches]|nr:hypothetical protein AeMF1_010945 [Aphanomyces euteiches]KAH9194443.1 hypothetical protein AeNC1_003586 [Aphanomyces euteiches]
MSAAGRKTKAGRPSHAVWAHFIRGGKRNRFHHHVYCRYCSQAQAQALTSDAAGPQSIEALRGVPETMLRHLSTCVYCPANVRLEMKLMMAQHRTMQQRKSRSTTSNPPLLDDLLLLEESDKATNQDSNHSRPGIDDSAPDSLSFAQITWGANDPYSCLWDENVRMLLPFKSLPSPDTVYSLTCSQNLQEMDEMSGLWTLSVNTWTSVSTREFFIACSIIQPSSSSSQTISITSVDKKVHAVTAHLIEVLATIKVQLVGVVCDSAMSLESARAAITSLELSLTSSLCIRYMLRLITARVFLKYKDIVQDVLFSPLATISDKTMPSLASWSTWIACVLRSKVVHPIADVCAALQDAYAALDNSDHTPLTTFDVVLLLAKLSSLDETSEMVDTLWATCDIPWMLLSKALYISSSPPKTSQVPALQWISLASYAHTFARQWQLNETQLTNDLVAFKEQKFPFDMVAGYANNVQAFYSFVSDSTPTFHSFCARLYGYVPQTIGLEAYIPGLNMAGLNPLMARTDIPVESMLTLVRFQLQQGRHVTPKRTYFPFDDPTTVWDADEWDSITEDLEIFIKDEMEHLHAIQQAPIVSLVELRECWRTNAC